MKQIRKITITTVTTLLLLLTIATKISMPVFTPPADTIGSEQSSIQPLADDDDDDIKKGAMK